MSENVNPNPAGAGENIETNNNDTSGKQVVPVATLVEERKKYKALVASLEKDAELARKIAKASNVDTDGLNAQFEAMQAKRNGTSQRATNVPASQIPQLSEMEKKIQQMQDTLDNNSRQNQLESAKGSGVLEITPDMEEDIMSFAKETGLSVKQAMYAKYGDAIVQNAQSASADGKRIAGAEKAFAGSLSGGGNTVPTGKLTLDPLQAEGANRAGIDDQEMRILMSGDSDAIQKFYSEMNKK